MKNWMKRLKSRAGETLIESMISILIFTFASIIMLTMISAAADINNRTKTASAELQAELTAVEKPMEEGVHGTAAVTLYGYTESVVVTSFGEEDHLNAYYVYQAE